MNIYQVATEYKSFVNDMLIKEELDESNIVQFNQLEGMLEDKAIAIASLINNLETEEKNINEAIKEMENRSSRIKKKYKWLKEYLKTALETCGMSEVRKSPYFSIKLKKNPPKVVIKKDEKIDGKYITKIIDLKVNLSLIKQDLENGVKLDYATLVQDTRIEIK
jgi:hypothetical protein